MAYFCISMANFRYGRCYLSESISSIIFDTRTVSEKENQCYIEGMADGKEDLVYPKSVYIIGGLVDRNRFKGINMTKALKQLNLL